MDNASSSPSKTKTPSASESPWCAWRFSLSFAWSHTYLANPPSNVIADLYLQNVGVKVI